jgi:hypothetical protein
VTLRRLALLVGALALPVAGLAAPAHAATEEPTITSGPTEPLTVNPDLHPVQITVDWAGGGEVHADWGGVTTVVQPGVLTTIDFGSATSGTSPITVYACPTPADGQAQSCRQTTTAPVTVDRVPPMPSLNLSPQRLYPVVDGYQDVAWLGANADGEVGRFDLSIVDSSGATVRTWTREQALAPGDVGWHGRNDARARVPDGVYRARLIAEDPAGNRADDLYGGAITVHHQRLVARTWHVVVRARHVLARKDQTRCSVVRTPSLRHWRGSVGYYSNSRCKARTFAGSVASGVHAVQVPKAVVPGTVTISAYGGAAKHHPHSVAALAAYNRNGDFLGSPTRLGSAVGWHRSKTRVAATMLHGRVLAWNVFASRGARYDVRSFRLVYRYQGLSR